MSVSTDAKPESVWNTSYENSAELEHLASGTDAAEANEGHVTGWRFWVLFIGLDLAQFLVQLEMTIVTTALLAIDDQLKDFKHSTWVVNAYFLSWSGLLVLWSQFSHTIGRKLSLVVALALFIVASAACSAAQTAVQLYVFRGIQGLAGGGVFNLCVIISREAVPLAVLMNVIRVLALISVASCATGPLIGGAITSHTTWRWVFILNVPVGVVALLFIIIALPNGFPHQEKPKSEQPRLRLSSLKQLDVVGGLLFLGLTLLSVTALQEADITYAWNSALVITLLTLSGVSGIAFVIWELYITRSRPSIMPVLTYCFAQRRTMAMFATSALIGTTFIFPLVQIPQRLQILDGLTPLHAAVKLLPFTIMIAFGAILGSVLGSRTLAQPVYGQVVGAMLQLIAVICFTVYPTYASSSGHYPARQYGFQILMGVGNGISYVTNYTGIQHIFSDRKDLISASSGAIMQFRYVGAALGLAAVAAAFNTHVRTHLAAFLDPDQTLALLQSSRLIVTLPAEDQARVLQVFAGAFALQWKIMCGFVGLQIVASLLTY